MVVHHFPSSGLARLAKPTWGPTRLPQKIQAWLRFRTPFGPQPLFGFPYVIFVALPWRGFAQGLHGLLVLLGRDVAAGEALPQDLLRGVYGCTWTRGPALSGEGAHREPDQKGQEYSQKQETDEHKRPP